MQGVILDYDSLGPQGLDFSGLHALPIDWTLYRDCTPKQVRQRIVPAQIVLTNKAPLKASDIAEASRLQFVSVLATGPILSTSSRRAPAMWWSAMYWTTGLGLWFSMSGP
jgi:hypothetical protein